jgi:hypothetical protein
MLLEDPDGAPYPEAVQAFARAYLLAVPPGDRPEWLLKLCEALEEVATAATAWGAQQVVNALLDAKVIYKVPDPDGEIVRGALSGGWVDLSTVTEPW